MHSILFVCHGNICRSPMAEMVMKYLVKEAGRESEFEIASAAVSTEEIGNDIYPPAKAKLREKGVPFERHAARQMTKGDYEYYDYIVCMDRSNVRWMQYIIGEDTEGKVSMMMDWVDREGGVNRSMRTGATAFRDVADPWYTGDFEATYQDIIVGTKAILQQLCE